MQVLTERELNRALRKGRVVPAPFELLAPAVAAEAEAARLTEFHA